MGAEYASELRVEIPPRSTLMGPRPADEAGRLAALRSYEVLDTPADPRIDVFVRVAAQFYGVPYSMVSLVDEDRTWFKASLGLDLAEIGREDAFCSHAVALPSQVMMVEDLRADDRFADNALVSGPNGFRFYAGAPIRTSDGHALGTLCILDHKARSLDAGELARLADLATGVGAVLDLHRSAVRLRRAATHDPLTGLANRALFEPALAEAVAAATDEVPATVICLDLDHFKQVNDRFGHAGGDTLLRVAADRLRHCLRASDLAARLGGDEFAVLLRGPLQPGGPQGVAERILATLAQPVQIDGTAVPVLASAGHATAPCDAMDGPVLMRLADEALYAAKATGRGTVAGPGRTLTARAPSLLDDLRLAVAGRAFAIAWQPYFDLRSRTLRGQEALVRWVRPGHGPVSPDLFVRLAEEHGLSMPIDHWMLSLACQDAAQSGHPSMGRAGVPEVTVNVAGDTFHDPGFAGQVASCLASSGLSGQRLVIEVGGPAACSDPHLARERVDELAALGVRVSLHNFGSGSTALACLREVPFSRIKLCRSYVQATVGTTLEGRGQDARQNALVRAMVQMGLALGSVVCAEGIETEAQLRFMRDAGCELGQGFLLGMPAPLPVGAA